MKYTKTKNMSLTDRAEKISDILSDHYVPERCPNCRSVGFSVFLGTDIISAKAQWDDRADRWRVSGISFGNLDLETVQCSSCGWRPDLPAEETPKATKQIDIGDR